MTKDHRDSNSLAWEELVKVEITKMKRTRRYGNEIDDSISDVPILTVQSIEG